MYPLEIISRTFDNWQADDLRRLITVQLGNGHVDLRKQLASALDKKLALLILGDFPFPPIDGLDGPSDVDARREAVLHQVPSDLVALFFARRGNQDDDFVGHR